MSHFSSRWLDYAPAQVEKPEPTPQQADKAVKSPKPPIDVAPIPVASLETVPRLPWQLERLLDAASSGCLPGSITLEAGLVRNLNRYVLAWGCSYLIGDRDESLRRLWQAHHVWHSAN